MITQTIFDLIFSLINMIVDMFPQIPGGDITSSLSGVLNFIFGYLDLFTIFVRAETIKLIIPLFLGVHYFEEIYDIVMWIIRKLPFSIE